MKIKFEDEFFPAILDRGYTYYENNLVEDVMKKGNTFYAKVLGNELYNVQVEIENNIFVDGSCDCPYADEGNYCKHMAALLYYLDENPITKEENYHSKEKELKIWLKKIGYDELQEFLVELLITDKSFSDKFRLKFSHIFPPLSLEEYKKKIRNAIITSGGRDGFIDYREAYDYTNAMYKILTEVETLVDKRHNELAFSVIKEILDSIPDTEIDDSNGSTGEIAYSCIEIIEEILMATTSDQEVSKKILDYLLEEVVTDRLSNYGIELCTLFHFYIKNNLYLETIEKSLLSALEQGKNKKYFWHENEYVEYLLDIYQQRQEKDKKFKLLKQYSTNQEICFQLVDEYLNLDQIDDAISLLKKRIKTTNEASYAWKLSEIYQANHQANEYKDILYQILYHLDKYNIKAYRKLKKLYPKQEWLNVREEIIRTLSKSKKNSLADDMLDIYIEEDRKEYIYEIVKEKGMDVIIHYEEYLLPQYNKELIKIYIDYCKRLVRVASNRHEYQTLAQYMKHIKKMKNSSKEYDELYTSIKEQYKNKPALQDELSKI